MFKGEDVKGRDLIQEVAQAGSCARMRPLWYTGQATMRIWSLRRVATSVPEGGRLRLEMSMVQWA